MITLKKLVIYSYQTNSLLKVYRFNENGVNIILGERKEEGKETNGVGKTTMVESIDYLLGGSFPEDFKGKVLLQEKDILLVLEIAQNNKIIFLGRLLNKPEAGYILYSKKISFDLRDWIDKNDSDFKNYINDEIIELAPDEPSFASLREYIMRDEKKGFIDIGLPNRNAVNESMFLAFLFNLPYNFEKEIQAIKSQQKDLNNRLKLINSIRSEVSELRIKERRLSREINELDGAVQKLKLSEKFSKDAETYQVYKSEYNDIRNSIFELEHIKKQYERNIIDLEKKLDEIKMLNDIAPFYKQLIDYFPDKIEKNQEEISSFYNFMVESRGKYFSNKIIDIDKKLLEKKKLAKEYEETIKRRTKVFRNTDILSDIANINEERNKKYEELAQARLKINMYDEKVAITAEINRIKQDILRLIEIKHEIFNTYRDKIAALKDLFNNFVFESYEETGVLDFELNNQTGINDSTGRIKITCKIDDEKSHGRLYMKINMFDLTWFVSGLSNNSNITFLIHDGSYSKPDKYAKAKLLENVDAILKSKEVGQYFVTLNIDELEESVVKNFDSRGSIIAKLLRSEDNKDRFFGFKYNS